MFCTNCQQKTNNPKFCSRSCGVAHNNKLQPKRKRQIVVVSCVNCAKQFECATNNPREFCSRDCRNNRRANIITKAKRFDIDGTPASPTVRRYLRQQTGNVCAICHQSGDNWCGKKLTLIVDHIDGDAHNWLVSNIRLVCPNCDSQLPTFKGRNKGKSTRKYTIIQK